MRTRSCSSADCGRVPCSSGQPALSLEGRESPARSVTLLCRAKPDKRKEEARNSDFRRRLSTLSSRLHTNRGRTENPLEAVSKLSPIKTTVP